MSEEEPIVPVTALAKLFELTDIRVQQLAKQEVVKKAKHGQYYLWSSVTGYIKYLRGGKKKTEAVDDPSGAEYEAHRARLTKAKADMAEMQRDLMRGTSHDAGAVAKVWADMIGNARTKLLAMPTKLAAQLEGMTITERQAAVGEAINAALAELADYSPEVITGEYVKAHEAEQADDDA